MQLAIKKPWGFVKYDIARVLEVVRTLVSFRATWDAKCDTMELYETVTEAPALKLCVRLWERERENSATLSEIPFEVVQRGKSATQKYIEQLRKSKFKLRRSKLGILGAGNSGKTSLAKSITTNKPSLEHPDNRTGGIDHHPHAFRDGENLYESTMWDFAGQDVYQPVHSLFFTRRTIYLVCVDMNSYSVGLKQAQLLADYDFQVDHFMDEFVDVKILKWIQLVISREPDAEFVFVVTKRDMVERNPRLAEISRVDLTKRLQQYVVETTSELKRLIEARLAVEETDKSERSDLPSLRFSVRQLETLRRTIQHLLKHDWVTVSCINGVSIGAARAKIEKIIVASDRSFTMPESYSRALNSIRSNYLSMCSSTRVKETFQTIEELIKTLRQINPNLDDDSHQEVIRMLHDLGDVLWYEDLGIARLEKEVILDPMLLIDFIRPIADHNYKSEIISHDHLEGLPFWLHLDPDRMLSMKQHLQEFRIAHAPRHEMKWYSDLIVPASWRSKSKASIRFGGQSLRFEFARLSAPSNSCFADVPLAALALHLTVEVRWEYRFACLLLESMFDQIVIASYKSLYDRQAGPDWIMYEKKDAFACRIVITRDKNTKKRLIRLEAVAACPSSQQAELWGVFEHLCTALECVLCGFHGLVVSRHVFKPTGESRVLEDVVTDWMETKPAHRVTVSWLPPALDWYHTFRKAAFDSPQEMRHFTSLI